MPHFRSTGCLFGETCTVWLSFVLPLPYFDVPQLILNLKNMLLEENEGIYDIQVSLLFTFSSMITLRDLINYSWIGTVTINFFKTEIQFSTQRVTALSHSEQHLVTVETQQWHMCRYDRMYFESHHHLSIIQVGWRETRILETWIHVQCKM